MLLIFKRLRQSLLLRLSLAISTITLLALLSVLVSVSVAETSAGEANAINQAGSLRMLLWRAVSRSSLRASAGPDPLLREFDQRLSSLQHLEQRRFLGDHTVLAAYPQVSEQWQHIVRPLLQSWYSDPAAMAQPALLGTLDAFTLDLDRLVQQIELDLEAKIQWLRALQAFLLTLILAVAALSLWMLKHHVAAPLRELLLTAQAVRAGRFNRTIAQPKEDELGQLGATFNTMVDNLSRMYGRLETLVAERTRELSQRNHSLQLLYRSTSRLSDGRLTLEKLLDLLQDVEQALGLGQGIICVRQNEGERAYPLATHIPESERAQLCERLGCTICFGLEQGSESHEYRLGDLCLVSVPLTSGGQWQGVMPFQLLPGSTIEPWQTQVLETLGRHVAVALANTRRSEEQRRLAVLEERSVIARELHDSIAQSLSYLKIQIALLQSRIPQRLQPELAHCVEELKVGLGNAYGELRELLTSFRITPGQTPFTQALANMTKELSQRCGFPILLEQRMGSMELSANEEIHLTSIIREALLNVQQHAQATWARVQLSADSLRQVRICIEDNGVGLPPEPRGPHHYGLTIMRDRAAILKGQLQFEARQEGGTRVSLGFVANTPYAQEAKAS